MFTVLGDFKRMQYTLWEKEEMAKYNERVCLIWISQHFYELEKMKNERLKFYKLVILNGNNTDKKDCIRIYFKFPVLPNINVKSNKVWNWI